MENRSDERTGRDERRSRTPPGARGRLSRPCLGTEPAETDRGVSALIGFIFVFAAIVVTMSVVQATLVPQQNHAVEVDHSQRVQADMQTARAAIVGSVDSTGPRSVSVELGTRYPSRLVFINPAPATGSLATIGTEPGANTITIANASAGGNAGDFWDGNARRYVTGGLIYRPEYDQYDDAPRVVYENSVLYSRFENTVLPQSSQTVIDGRAITLVTLDGNVSTRGVGSRSIDVRPVSSSGNAVAVTGAAGNVTISLPTRLSAATWTALLDGEFVANGSGGHVVGVDVSPVPNSAFDEVRIELESDVTYDVRLAKVGIGSGVLGTEPAYVVDRSGNNTDRQVGGDQRLVVEVRDRFDNPVSGAPVTFTTDDGTFGDGSTQTVLTTGADGRASVSFTSTTAGDATVLAGIEGDDDDTLVDEPAEMTASFRVSFRDGGSNYTVNDPTDVRKSGATIRGGQGNRPAFLDVTLENAAESARTIERIRVGFYYSADATSPTNWSETTYAPGPHEIGGPYTPLSPSVTLAPGESRTLQFELLEADGTNYAVDADHHIVTSIVLANGSARTFVIQPEN